MAWTSAPIVSGLAGFRIADKDRLSLHFGSQRGQARLSLRPGPRHSRGTDGAGRSVVVEVSGVLLAVREYQGSEQMLVRLRQSHLAVAVRAQRADVTLGSTSCLNRARRCRLRAWSCPCGTIRRRVVGEQTTHLRRMLLQEREETRG